MSKRTLIGDSSGSPGAATLNYAAGKSAVAQGASSVVITTPFVSADDLVIISPLDIDATLVSWKVAAAAGSFTLTGNANATAAWKFGWHIVKRGDPVASDL